MKTNPKQWRVGLVGYGEVGCILAEDLRAQGIAVCAYDLKLDHADTAAPMQDHAAQHGVALLGSSGELAAGSDLIISAVTASQTVGVAQACAGSVRAGQLFS